MASDTVASHMDNYGATTSFLKLENFSSNCMEKGDKYIIQNIYFCIQQKKHSHTWDDIKVS